MRIVCISDTHGMLDRIDVPDGDVLIHAGDGTMSGQGKQIKKWRRDLEALPHKHKIIIAGNHDIKFETDPARALELLGDGVTYLQDSWVDIDGLTFWGCPWTPPFGHGWAFNEALPPLPLRHCRPDVLITHGPPRGVLDFVPRDRKHVGCPVWAEYIKHHPPLLHVFGHIHEGYGQEGIHVNASCCDAMYRPINAPIVVDL